MKQQLLLSAGAREHMEYQAWRKSVRQTVRRGTWTTTILQRRFLLAWPGWSGMERATGIASSCIGRALMVPQQHGTWALLCDLST
eukprot:3063441-Pleurochrysis_carterae.AAC.1